MNQYVCRLLDWYQLRIGSNDKQSWEKSLDPKSLKNNLYCIPKKSTKIDDLIDIDLVKGSSFPKTKSRHGLLNIIFNGIIKLVLLPIYFKWWQYQTNKLFSFILLIVYLLQISNIYIYNTEKINLTYNQTRIISIAEILTPSLIMIILGIMYTYITSSIPSNSCDLENDSNISSTRHCNTLVDEKYEYDYISMSNQYDHHVRKEDDECRNNIEKLKNIYESTAENTTKSTIGKQKTENGGNEVDDRNAMDDGDQSDASNNKSCRRFLSKSLSINDPIATMTIVSADDNQVVDNRDKEINLNTDFSLLLNDGLRKRNINNKNIKSKIDFSSPNDSMLTNMNKKPINKSTLKPNLSLNELQSVIKKNAAAKVANASKESSINMSCNNNTSAETSNKVRNILNDDDDELDLYDEQTCSSSCYSSPSIRTDDMALATKAQNSFFINKNQNNGTNKKSNEYYLNYADYDDDDFDDDDDDENELTESDQTELCSYNDQNNNNNVYTVGDSKKDNLMIVNKRVFLHVKKSKTSLANNDLSSTDQSSKSSSSVTAKFDNRSNLVGTTLSKYNKKPMSISMNVVKEKISCIIWENNTNEWKGTDLSMLDIANYIISNAEKIPVAASYFYIGVLFSILISVLPIYFHNNEILTKNFKEQQSQFNLSQNESVLNNLHKNETKNPMNFFNIPFLNVYVSSISLLVTYWTSIDLKVSFLVLNTLITTMFLCMVFFSLLTIAERTLNQRFLHAKFFCYLTSNRRARKHNLPHFRLGRVENIKTWLSVRSFMKRRGPQRSIDSIISCTFIIGVGLCAAVCIRFLQDADFLSENLLNWQLVVWCLCIWTFMLRFMTIAFKINKKYRNCMSTVITEQINLYLQMEKTPAKKDELTVVNNVLKLAADLLKEIENPFKISGLGVDPWVYNVTKVVILSAASAVLSELFGFKLKLYKIKIG